MERIVLIMATKKFDVTVILFGLILFIYGSYQLNHLKFENEIAGLTIPIALIQASANTVKKKAAINIGWMDAWEGEPLFNRDQIFTYNDSNAVIEFINGPSIQVSEKTLFKVQVSEGVINLDLEDGAIIAKINKSTGLFRVSIKNKIYEFSSDQAKIRLSRKNNKDQVHVIEGKVKIASNQQTINIEKNQKIKLINDISLKSSAIIDVPKNDVTLEVPELADMAESYNFYNEEHSPILTWKNIKGAKSYKIEITSSSSGKIVHQKISLINEYKMPILTGHFRIRIAAIDSDGLMHNFSEQKSISIHYGTWDRADGSVKIELKKPDQLVEFNWGEKNQVGQFEFELSSTPKFQKLLTKRILNKTSTHISFPKQGSFYWRAKQILGNGKVIYQKPVKVIVSPSPPPVKPILEKELKIKIKNNKTSLFWFMDLFFPKAHAGDNYAEIPLPVNQDAKSYLIEIFKDPKGEKLILKGKSSGKNFRMYNPQVGQYYYRIAVIDFWDRQSPFSEIVKMTLEPSEIKKEIRQKKIKLLSPQHREKVSVIKQKFTWSSEHDEKFTFQIALDLNFLNVILEKKLKSNSLTLEAKKLPSRFFWRVIQGNKRSLRRSLTIIRKPKVTKRLKTAVKSKAIQKNKLHKRKMKTQIVKIQPNQTKVWIAYKPTLTNYKSNPGRNTVLIDGTAINGFQLGWNTGEINHLRKDRYYEVQYTRSAGTVFEDLKYRNQKLRLSFGDKYFELPFSLKLNLGASDIINYTVLNSNLSEKSEVLFYGGVGFHYPFNLFTLSFEGFINFEMGTATLIEGGLNNYYQISKSYKMFFGVSYESQEFEIDNKETHLKQTSAILGLSKIF